jgi:hypothetical protein
MIVQQKGTTNQRDNFVPLSDGAREVVEIGSGTTRFRVAAAHLVKSVKSMSWLFT